MHELALDTIFNQQFSRLSRSLIGFEPTLRRLAMGESLDNSTGYPPYNLERLDDTNYRITLAVAGFNTDQLDITIVDNKLTIVGNTVDRVEDDSRFFVHKGIAERSFTRTFLLADHVSVMNVELENGLLTVELKQEVPEALKPRKISISQKGVIDSAPVKSAVA